MAYANSSELPLHTDFPSLTTPPQLQLLHMIQRADEGGLSVFVDGFHVAEQLRKERPDVFEILSTFDAEYIEEGFDKHEIDGHERTFDYDMTARHKVIETARDGSIRKVTFGNAMRSWFYDVDDERKIQQIYDAMKVFTEYCYDPKNLYQFQLENGETVLWANTRLLHSRTNFRTINHSRTLMGCYFAWDILKSRVRTIRDKLNLPENQPSAVLTNRRAQLSGPAECPTRHQKTAEQAMIAAVRLPPHRPIAALADGRMAAIKAITFALLALTMSSATKPKELIIVTVATEETDGLRRLMRTAQDHDHHLFVYGRGEQWNGGDMRYYQGGGQKIRILRDALKNYKDKDAVIMFVDAYDVVVNAKTDIILDRFYHEFDNARIVFGAEGFCWPDKELATKYPLVSFGKRYLNSGLYMGYVSDIYKMLEMGAEVKDTDDDQLFFTNLYLDEKTRNDLRISLDSMSHIFQNLNGAADDVKVEYKNGKAQLVNVVYNTEPVVIHGNGPSKKHLNTLANYVGNSYSNTDGCVQCKVEKVFDFSRVEKADHPFVSILAFIQKPIPFVEEFLQNIAELDYDKSRLNFYIYNNQKYNEETVENFTKKYKNQFNMIHSDNGAYELAEREARSVALGWANEVNSDFAIVLDADAHITNAHALKLLIEKAINHRIGVIAPMVGQPGKLFTNFWGALSEHGYYARSEDYLDIVGGKQQGFWNVPFVTSAVLLSREKIVDLKSGYSYNANIDPDMSFCQYARDHGSFLFVDNEEDYGFLVVSDDFEENVRKYKNPEMYEIFMNRKLWEDRYVPRKYFAVLEPDTVLDQPCPDVYDFPLMSERFCAEMIEEMEHFGQWSSGKHEDNRLSGGYENVPTRDIHMNQVGFERHWLYFVDEYVRPVQEKVYTGYYHQPVESVMMFVVRYKPEEQPSLRPHHDASTYSIDIALNKRGRDYEGGGVRYIRYNCTVAADEVGYSMLFPGRLTHLHEGLPTTKGTRYIAVSFLNP
ncbi:hypothetical protein QR680_000047 [Steinernema hermaphroditum]|uniref:procollagen-lysine 5-dioxygenase n=1 Tax=Steinernema hermaphroditum TaxID=289476 RepID=A0AA39GT34_9BILA|nr:hypothetical protein QR680_000047 [Steinernema hermaphroditum]